MSRSQKRDIAPVPKWGWAYPYLAKVENVPPPEGLLYDIITACHNYLTDLTVNPIQVNLARHVF
jgi:hypothetical protein